MYKQSSNQIWVTFAKEGVHCYPAALTNLKLASGDQYDVSFLGHPHRHIFHFKVAIDVLHNDRDIEFIQFKRWLENLYSEGILQLDYQSCEMMADGIARHIGGTFPHRNFSVEVSEDGENGCIKHYETLGDQ